jgi:orotidine-5'-phosphate decarboxylase
MCCERSVAIEHFADRLLAACDAKGPVCVGLDPVFGRLPIALQDRAPHEAIEAFARAVIDAVADHVAVVKPQIACFERYGADGYGAYERVVDAAKQRGLIVIGDAKRGDIGSSSSHYAAGLLANPRGADALTVNSYLGDDGLEPFVRLAAEEGKGLFVLVRTSNPGGDALQTLELADGRTVAEAVADMVAQLGERYAGDAGYSCIGAVVGATKTAEQQSLRHRMPRQLFLVPGFGAQGGTAEGVRGCFDGEGRGAIITASRSVIYAFDQTSADWQSSIAEAAIELRQQIQEIIAR